MERGDFDLTSCPEFWALAMEANSRLLEQVPNLYEFSTDLMP